LAKDQGQDYIPVHIFPVRFNVAKSVNFLNNLTKDDPVLKKFASRLEDAFDYFDRYKQLPVVMIGDNGEYLIDGALPHKLVVDKNDKTAKTATVGKKTRNVGVVPDAVGQWPQFPGGGEAFMKWLDQLGKDMVPFLPAGMKRAFVQVEFIVDKDGETVNYKVLRGINSQEFETELLNRMETMPKWQPALVGEKPVPKKMIQTVTVESR
jgi:hypothetical protein